MFAGLFRLVTAGAAGAIRLRTMTMFVPFAATTAAAAAVFVPPTLFMALSRFRTLFGGARRLPLPVEVVGVGVGVGVGRSSFPLLLRVFPVPRRT